jgi:hypothetical protein
MFSGHGGSFFSHKVQGPLTLPPEVKETAERTHILSMVIERMQQNPLPVDAPRLTREALHERR